MDPLERQRAYDEGRADERLRILRAVTGDPPGPIESFFFAILEFIGNALGVVLIGFIILFCLVFAYGMYLGSLPKAHPLPTADAHGPAVRDPQIALQTKQKSKRRVRDTIPDEPDLQIQRLPDANGRCGYPDVFAIKGGCWMRENPAPCDELQNEYKGQCYVMFASPEFEAKVKAEHQ